VHGGLGIRVASKQGGAESPALHKGMAGARTRPGPSGFQPPPDGPILSALAARQATARAPDAFGRSARRQEGQQIPARLSQGKPPATDRLLPRLERRGLLGCRLFACSVAAGHTPPTRYADPGGGAKDERTLSDRNTWTLRASLSVSPTARRRKPRAVMGVGAKGVSQQPGVGVHQGPSQAPVFPPPPASGGLRAPPLWLPTRAATTANHYPQVCLPLSRFA
jgi:hypothetical protein